jgi:hypothetical protein
MPSSRYAQGQKAWGLCQRCGIRFLLNDLVFDGYMPGLRVCVDCYDSRHPQEYPIDVTDPQALYRPAPDSVAFTAPILTVIQGTSPVKLAWTVADFGAYTVGSYSVFRSTSGEPFVSLATFNNTEDILQDGNPGIGETLAYTDSTVVHLTTYRYYIQAVTLTSNSVALYTINSNTVTVTP